MTKETAATKSLTRAVKHIVPVIIPDWKKEKPACESCQASCQSACKTSCTVSNQPCPEK